ncbi:adenine glycosylase [Collinsella intestinalis]|uniref:adenine glycosylase n=1 Tax=Collinsella intestinalis TaxID=147207 RepID=UPI0025A34FC0|nr:adenine glycosylase [Collinsella intestinalis]MDM8164182.1 adenine glycosylase [Collinsella intestinalis]
MEVSSFRQLMRAEGTARYRDLMWRRTRDPYIIWLSEVMLQQTQVPRVEVHLPRWLERFPSLAALSEAPVADVLAQWQGMGYNRRALALHEAARQVMERFDGMFPSATADLISLPGIGPATAQGIRAFAFDLPGVYLETNVRTVFLHHFFPDVPGVPDRELVPLIEATCPAAPAGEDGGASAPDSAGAPLAPGAAHDVAPFATPLDADDTPRNWYYALLDYGAYLKKTIPNPSRRSAGHVRQKPFEGSRRQKRAEVVRLLLAAREDGACGLTAAEVTAELDAFEAKAGRGPVERGLAEELLAKLAQEGFCVAQDGRWSIA